MLTASVFEVAKLMNDPVEIWLKAVYALLVVPKISANSPICELLVHVSLLAQLAAA